MTEHTKAELLEDIRFLLARNMNAGVCRFDGERDTGISSNSLVRLAYRPDSGISMPSDQSDLDACERAFQRLPAHRKGSHVVAALGAMRQHIKAKWGDTNE